MTDVPEATNWAVTECADADLGDLRRTQRLVQLAHVLAQHPGAALPAACGRSARLNAADRFFANDDMEPPEIVPSHLEATSSRLNPVPLVLAVHDTTAADWTRVRATEGVGPLGHPAGQGLLVQTTLAITPDRVPLGLVAQPVGARDPNDVGTRARRTPLPISQQERPQWLWRVEAVCTAQAGCPHTRLVSVGDRAADGDDVLAAQRPAGVDRRIRAAWERCVSAPPRAVWTAVEAQPVVTTIVRHVPRRGLQPAREATLARRSGPWTGCPPPHRKAAGLPAVSRWAVQVRAVEAPAEVEPIAWGLWTTVAVDTMDDALARVHWYAGRWGREVWQRMWQSGCRLEARPCATAQRLQRGLALSSVLAGRIVDATMVARVVPEAPCSVLLAPDEWPALSGAMHRVPQPPPEPPSLGQAVNWIAPLGGLVGRRRRDRPGAEVLWRGFQHRGDLTTMYGMMRHGPPYMNICVQLSGDSPGGRRHYCLGWLRQCIQPCDPGWKGDDPAE